MGGGDLNLKKSWHPHTIKNQEKVWKAEQAKSHEEKKLNDLRREIEEEKNRDELRRIGRESGVLGRGNDSDKKLDWMYKSSTDLINREEYLLGRKIDKSFEILQAEEKEQKNLVGVKQPLNHVEHDCVPFSIRAYKNFENPEQVDLPRKVLEDPLMLIKQREMESRRKILENPVKLKELHRILKTDEKLQKISKKSKKSRKNYKRKKSLYSGSSASDSDSELDSKLAKKLKGGLLNKDEASSLGIHLTKLLDSKFEKISQELDKAAGKKRKRAKKNKSKNDSDTDSSSSQRKTYINRRSRSISENRKFKNLDRRSRSVSRDRLYRYEEKRSRSSAKINYSDRSKDRNFRSISRPRDHSTKRRSRSLSRNVHHKDVIHANRSIPYTSERKIRNRIESTSSSKDYRNSSKSHSKSSPGCKKSYRSRSKSPLKTSSRTTPQRPQKNEIRRTSTTQRYSKLTDEEKQAKLREMMSNAAWREEERTEVVHKHREAYAREERYTRTEFDQDFLNKEVKKAMANQTSVGTRLRANLNNIQRTSASMNSNFARK